MKDERAVAVIDPQGPHLSPAYHQSTVFCFALKKKLMARECPYLWLRSRHLSLLLLLEMVVQEGACAIFTLLCSFLPRRVHGCSMTVVMMI